MTAHKYSNALRRVAKLFATVRNGGDILRAMASYDADMVSEGDTVGFTLARPLHWFCAWNYDGQGDTLYEILCALDYTPGCMESGPSEDDMPLYWDICSAYEGDR